MQAQFSGEPKKFPTVGRAGFFVVVIMWVGFLFLLFFGEGRVDRQVTSAVMPLLGWGSYAVGMVSSVISLLRGEQKKYAVRTLIMLVLAPLVFFAIGLLFLFIYGFGLSL